MSYVIPIEELTREQLLFISQNACVEQKRGKRSSLTHILHHKLNVDDEPHVMVPMAMKAMLCSKIVGDPYIKFNDDNRPNHEMFHKRIEFNINSSFNLRDNQPQVVDDAIKNLKKYSTCLLELSCNYGKTCMSVYLAQKMGFKWLFVTPRKILKKQTLRDANMVTPSNIQIITSKTAIDPNASGYIISSFILKNYTFEDFSSVGTIILDEIHMLLTMGFIPNLSKLCPKFLIALSATPDRKDGMDNALSLYIDKRSHVTAFVVRPVKHIKVVTELKLKVKLTRMNEVDWGYMIEQQTTCEWRNLTIATLAKMYKEYRPVILSNRREQVREIYTMLRNMDVSADTFMEDDEDFDRTSEVVVAIATKIGVGFDGDFNACIFASDYTDIRQLLGRLGRKVTDETFRPIVIDFVDNFSTMEKHYKERLFQMSKYCGLTNYDVYYAYNNMLLLD